MSTRAASWLAWSLAAVCVVMATLALLFHLLTPSGSKGAFSLGLNALFAIFLVLLPAVGALVASRHPRNPIGWIFAVRASFLRAGSSPMNTQAML